MTSAAATLRVDCRNQLGEAPLWCEATQTLYWIDVLKPGRVFHWQLADDCLDFWQFDHLVTGVNLAEGGQLLVHGKDRILVFDPKTATHHPVFMLSEADAGMRFNDGRCDRSGRLWVGTMPNNISEEGGALDIKEKNGQILMITPTSSQRINARLGCPNAICWSPDESTFYVADSCDGWLYAYQFDSARGMISEQRRFSYLDGLGIPDGAAVDREGFLWNARWGAGAVARIAPDGSLDRLVKLPVSQPTSCCFGAEDGCTLFITSARFSLDAAALRAEPLAGGIFSIPVEVPGLKSTKFSLL